MMSTATNSSIRNFNIDEPLQLFSVCELKVTGQMQLQHQDHGIAVFR